jgi:VCBS repeat-containing protein
MISINKYGQNIDLSNVQELNGKKSYSLDNIDSSKTLLIKIPQGVKFVTTLQDEDLKVNFTDKEGNVFELILKNISDILVQNDGDKLIEIIREESNEILASITDLASALEATAAGGEQAQGNQTSTNSDSGRVNEFENDGLDFEENSYPNDRVFEDASSQETTVTQPALSSLNNLIDEEQVLNSAPTIEVNSTLTVDEDNSTTITFTLNDIDGDILTSNATAINGVVTINGNVITYTPNENFNGNDVITLSVNDGTVTTTQTINVTINPVNDAPTIEVNSTLTVDEDDTTTIIFVSNDIDGDTLTSNATAINGVVTINGNVITYTPNENFNGNDVITLSVNDGTVTTTQTINVTINPVNDAPTIEIQENSLLENIILEGQLTASDIDTNFANLIFSTIEVIDGFVLNTDGSYTFDANKYDYLAEGEILELAIPITVTDDFNASASSVLNIKITGTNDRPIINVEPIIELSETDLSSTATLPDVYYVISEAELFEMLEITDVDSNDGLSLSLVSNSSVFTSVNAGITEGINGVVQLTQERIDALGIEANVGDFFVFSNGFDGLGENEIANVSFEVVAIDNSGAENAMSEIKKVSIVITGTNDRLVTSVVYTQIQNDDTSKVYKGQLSAKDVDLNDTLTYSIDNTSVNVALTISNINGLSTLTNLNTSALESVFQDIKPVVTNFIATGDLSGLLTLNPQTIATTKTAVVILQGLLNSNPDLKNSIVLLKDFVVANQDSIIENTSLVAQDIVLLQDLLTQENLTALGNLYNSLNLFIYNNPQIKDLATSILADNIISPSELMSIDPVLLVQIEALRVQLKSIIDSNSNILELISITQVIEKLQEVVTIDTTNNQVSIESKVTPTLAGMILTLDEDTGEYIVNNAFAEKFSSLGNLEISFDYNATDSQGTTDSSTASILITTEEINDTSISLDDGGILSFGEEQNINLGDLLENISTSVEIQDIDSIDLSNSEHILSNLTIKDFEDMVADDSSNTLVIDGENNDKIKLDLSVWSKDENDKDINTINESEDDGYITYTAKGTAEQTLTLLIDKDIVVENI